MIWRQVPKIRRPRPLRPPPRFLARRPLPVHQLGRAAGIHARRRTWRRTPARSCGSTRTAASRPTIRSPRQGGVAAQIWTLGHRNPLGIAFAPDGRLWEVEMGPRGGDELNLIQRGRNYGYPRVSNGDHYDGRADPRSQPRRRLRGAESLVDAGDLAGRHDHLFGGDVPAMARRRADRRPVGRGPDPGRHRRRRPPARPSAGRWASASARSSRHPDGSVWLLEDQQEAGGAGGRLLRLTPAAR